MHPGAVAGGDGRQPEPFKSPTRPVEQVSFEDVQTFLNKLNAQVPGLNLCCRRRRSGNMPAGRGPTRRPMPGMRILGENNAPVLDAIAWYGGNSGVGFELENGLRLQRLAGEAIRPHSGRERDRWR